MALCIGAVLLFASLSMAAVTDVQDFSKQTGSTYFVDVDANKYNAPYYRGYGQDWGWTHSAIAGTITSATISISAFDVDAPSEVDNIFAYDNGIKTLLGSLSGGNNIWAFSNFTLGSNFYDDIAGGLQVWMEIDTGTHGSWLVTLAKSALSIDGGTLPPPTPGAVPEPGTLLLLGVGAAGVAWMRRRKAA